MHAVYKKNRDCPFRKNLIEVFFFLTDFYESVESIVARRGIYKPPDQALILTFSLLRPRSSLLSL